MNLKTYAQIKYYCLRKLVRNLHSRHLEDITQYVAMRHFETDGKNSWEWSFADYCRENGLGLKRSKLGARAIEYSLSIDAPCLTGEDQNSMYLLDAESLIRSEKDYSRINAHDEIKGILEDFLSPLKLSQEAMKWVLKSYKVKMN